MLYMIPASFPSNMIVLSVRKPKSPRFLEPSGERSAPLYPTACRMSPFLFRLSFLSFASAFLARTGRFPRSTLRPSLISIPCSPPPVPFFSPVLCRIPNGRPAFFSESSDTEQVYQIFPGLRTNTPPPTLSFSSLFRHSLDPSRLGVYSVMNRLLDSSFRDRVDERRPIFHSLIFSRDTYR